MAVYSMVAYERVFFSHTYHVNYVMNYNNNFVLIDFTHIEKKDI